LLNVLPIFPCNEAKQPLTAHGFRDARRSAKERLAPRWFRHWQR